MVYVKRWIGESALLFSAVTCSPHPWGISRVEQEKEQRLQKCGGYVHSLGDAGTRPGGPRHLDTCSLSKDVRPDTMHLSRLMTVKTGCTSFGTAGSCPGGWPHNGVPLHGPEISDTLYTYMAPALLLEQAWSCPEGKQVCDDEKSRAQCLNSGS